MRLKYDILINESNFRKFCEEYKMTAEQRKQKISELLKENDSVRVTELSRLFNVSEVTFRSYLEDMEK